MRLACYPSHLSSWYQVLFILFEHASGYAVFRCEGAEDIGSLLPEVQEAVLDFARFGSMIDLVAFSPFKTGANALENINCISEGKFASSPLRWSVALASLRGWDERDT